MSKRFYVYGIFDPRDGTCRYIGKGSRGRAFSHLSKTHNQKLAEMLRECENIGLFVEPKILETYATSKGAATRERELIRWHSPTLFNCRGRDPDSPHPTNQRFKKSPVHQKQAEIKSKLLKSNEYSHYQQALNNWSRLKP